MLTVHRRGDTLAIVARANDMEAAGVGWINEVEWYARLDGYRAYREVCRGHFNVIDRTGRTAWSAGSLATTGRRKCPKQKQGEDE